MGIVTNLRTALGVKPRVDYLASPFTEGELAKIVWSDVFGANYAPISRADAMSIPAMAKARQLICATIAKLPLKAAVGGDLLDDKKQPRWTYRTDGTLSPFARMIWTVDDLLFYGESLWQVDRGADTFPIRAERVPYEWWKVTPEGAITIHDVVQNADDVLYFPGSVEGILDKDGTSLRSAKAIAAAVESRTKTPIPVMEIHGNQIDDAPTTAEAKALVADYNKARRDPDGVTVYTPPNVELKPHGEKTDSGFMVEGRNAVRLDIANLTGVPAALLDGSVSTASLTYSTQEGRRNEFVDYGLSIWMETIAGRLSLDDVVPSGQRITFDQTDFLTTLPSPTGADVQD